MLSRSFPKGRARFMKHCYLHHQHSQISHPAAEASICGGGNPIRQHLQTNLPYPQLQISSPWHNHTTGKTFFCPRGCLNQQIAQQRPSVSSELLLPSVCQQQQTCGHGQTDEHRDKNVPFPLSKPASATGALSVLKRGRHQKIGGHGSVMKGNAQCHNDSEQSLASNRGGNGNTIECRCSPDTKDHFHNDIVKGYEFSQVLGHSSSVLPMTHQRGEVLSSCCSAVSELSTSESAFASMLNGENDGGLAIMENSSSGRADPRMSLQPLIRPVESSEEGDGFEFLRKVKLVNQLSPKCASNLLKNRAFVCCSFEQLEAVIKVLRNYFVSDERVFKVLAKNTRVLSHPVGILQQKLKVLTFYQIETETVYKISTSWCVLNMSVSTLQERLALFEEIGLSEEARNKALCRGPTVLLLSTKKLMKSLNYLKSIGATREILLMALKDKPTLFSLSLNDNLIPRYNHLQQIGISAQKIPLVLTFSSRINIDKMKARTQNLKDLGFSDDNVRSLLEKHPDLVARSPETLKKIVDFLVHETEWNMKDIALFPACLSLSLERRIIPRCRIARKHALTKVYSLATILGYSDSRFEKLRWK